MDPTQTGPSAGAMAQQKVLENAAAQAAENQRIAAEKNAKPASKLVTFYASLSGCPYYTKTGKACVFHNGRYATDLPAEIEELTELCKQPNQHLIYDHEVAVHIPDVQIMKEVNMGGGGGTVVTGPVSSVHIAGLTPR